VELATTSGLSGNADRAHVTAGEKRHGSFLSLVHHWRVSSELAPVEHVSASGDPLVRVRLVPVEVFGADEEDCRGCGGTIKCGYGLMDAVQAWSDCNRAIGHIFRKDDDYTEGYRESGDTITVYVPQSEMALFERRYGDEAGNRCPACHVEYRDLPEGHRVKRPECEIAP
jgi:hypothetical protein